jgi:hypothetical protein
VPTTQAIPHLLTRFGKLINTLTEMEEAVSVYTSRVAEKLTLPHWAEMA